MSVNTRSADSFASFKRRLNTKLFTSTYVTYMVQRHHSAQIRVSCDLSRYINLVVVVVVVVAVVVVVVVVDLQAAAVVVPQPADSQHVGSTATCSSQLGSTPIYFTYCTFHST